MDETRARTGSELLDSGRIKLMHIKAIRPDFDYHSFAIILYLSERDKRRITMARKQSSEVTIKKQKKAPARVARNWPLSTFCE